MSEPGRPTGDIEEDVFLILSHPIRRKILKEMFEEGSVSFTKMSKEWGLSTGVIYHHLKLLKPLIKQENKKYVLTDKGYEVCEWFLRTKAGRVSVEKVSFFSEHANKLLYFISEHKTFFTMILLAGWSVAAWVSAVIGAVMLGPLFFGQGDIEKPGLLITISVSSLLVGIALQSVALLLNGKRPSLRAVAGFLFSTLFAVLFIFLFWGLSLLGITPVRTLWLLTMVISQAWFIAINTLVLSNYYALSIERSALFSIIMLYVYVFASFLFITG